MARITKRPIHRGVVCRQLGMYNGQVANNTEPERARDGARKFRSYHDRCTWLETIPAMPTEKLKMKVVSQKVPRLVCRATQVFLDKVEATGWP